MVKDKNKKIKVGNSSKAPKIPESEEQVLATPEANTKNPEEPHNQQDDEDINTVVTPTTPTTIHTWLITRARARQLNHQVLLFLGNVSNVHENVMLPNLDTFVLLTIEGHSTDKKDGYWSMIKHGDEGVCEENKNEGSSGDFRTLKPP